MRRTYAHNSRHLPKEIITGDRIDFPEFPIPVQICLKLFLERTSPPRRRFKLSEQIFRQYLLGVPELNWILVGQRRVLVQMLSAHSVHPAKMLGWIVLVRE